MEGGVSALSARKTGRNENWTKMFLKRYDVMMTSLERSHDHV